MEIPTIVPQVTFKTRVRDESIGGENPYRWQDVTTDDIFKGKKVVLFALPGAFTPTCDAEHLPGYERLYQQFKDAGVDEVVCLSVNDAFVMNAWGRKLNAEDVRLIPDGNAEFTEQMGMLVEKYNLGFGKRSWRYSALVEDGEIKKLFEEPGKPPHQSHRRSLEQRGAQQCDWCGGKRDNADDDPFEVSDAETMLEYLKKNQ